MMATDNDGSLACNARAVLNRLVQSVPGLHMLRNVLLVKEEAAAPLGWLLHINSPHYDEVTSEQMCLMLMADSNVNLILNRVQACK